MNRVAISCLTFSAAVRCSCSGRSRFFIPRVALATPFQRYASTSLIKNAAEKGKETNPDSILKTKGKVKGNVSVDLPEAKKQASLIYDTYNFPHLEGHTLFSRTNYATIANR